MVFRDENLLRRFDDLNLEKAPEMGDLDYRWGLSVRTAEKMVEMYHSDDYKICGVSYWPGELGVCVIRPDSVPTWNVTLYEAKIAYPTRSSGLAQTFRAAFRHFDVSNAVAFVENNFSEKSFCPSSLPYTVGVIATVLEDAFVLGPELVDEVRVRSLVVRDSVYEYPSRATAALATALYGLVSSFGRMWD